MNGGLDAALSRTLRIAVVEDSPLFMEIACSILADTEHVVVAKCATAADGLREIPGIDADLVIMDVNLPDGNGIDVARTLLASNPQIRVTFLSDFSRPVALQGLPAESRARISYILKARLSSRSEFAELITRSLTGSIVDPSVLEPSDITAGHVVTVDPGDLDFMELLAQGLSERRIAETLGISRRQVRTRLKRLMSNSESRHGPSKQVDRRPWWTRRASP